ncbi:hypothetical protein [Methanoculleus sp. 7T]|uniref:hypothetical protein n=1 Tax=Methanoculleus sp. 7T TaxID=2937282 RepID=UPI0020C0422D|nr:hypothetical protein [Methanoculleus sp. 7T]MCK8517421.1 hypothetical protein [Methanoculleus sp. 7T]
MKPHGMPGRPPGLLLMILAALLIVPCTVLGATPPLLPYLTVSVSNDTLSQEEDLGVSAVWSRDASSYRPPESVDVRLYAVPSGSFVARYTIPTDGRAASGETTRHFRGVIASSELPAGRLLLVVTDPVSGADDRVVINVTEPGPDYPDVQTQRYVDTVFSWAAAVLLVVLGAGLALLVKRP